MRASQSGETTTPAPTRAIGTAITTLTTRERSPSLDITGLTEEPLLLRVQGINTSGRSRWRNRLVSGAGFHHRPRWRSILGNLPPPPASPPRQPSLTSTQHGWRHHHRQTLLGDNDGGTTEASQDNAITVSNAQPGNLVGEITSGLVQPFTTTGPRHRTGSRTVGIGLDQFYAQFDPSVAYPKPISSVGGNSTTIPTQPSRIHPVTTITGSSRTVLTRHIHPAQDRHPLGRRKGNRLEWQPLRRGFNLGRYL